jgi:hypothetical protein
VATTYKQPRRLNSVSIMLAVVLGLGAWLGISTWPLIAVNANVKNEIGEALPRAYKANLLPEPTSTEGIARIHDELVETIKKLGVADPKAEVTITRDKKVGIQVRYKATITLKGTDKTYDLTFEPNVETDAARVEW